MGIFLPASEEAGRTAPGGWRGWGCVKDGPRAPVRRGQRGRSVPPRGTDPGLGSLRSTVLPTPDPAALRSAVGGLRPPGRSPELRPDFFPVCLPAPPAGSRPLPPGSPRAAVPCPPPLISHFKAARRGAAAPSAVLRLRTVTPETLLLPFPGHPAPAPPTRRWQLGAPGAQSLCPRLPSLPRTAIPSGVWGAERPRKRFNKELESSDWL